MRIELSESPVPMETDEQAQSNATGVGTEAFFVEPSTQTNDINRRLAEQISAYLKNPDRNWPSKLDQLWREAPNLAHLIGVMAYTLAGEPNEYIAFNGNMVQVGNQNRGTCNPFYVDFSAPNDDQGAMDGTSTTQSLENVLARALENLLEQLPIEGQTGPQTVSGHGALVDISRTHASQLVNQFLTGFVPESTPTHSRPNEVQAGAVSQEERVRVLSEKPAKASFFAAVNAALFSKDTAKPPIARFCIAESSDAEKKEFSDTFCPNIKRKHMQTDSNTDGNYQITQGEGDPIKCQLQEVHNWAEGGLAQLAKHHNSAENPALLAFASMPLFVHLAYAYAQNDNENAIHPQAIQIDQEQNQEIQNNLQLAAARANERTIARARIMAQQQIQTEQRRQAMMPIAQAYGLHPDQVSDFVEFIAARPGYTQEIEPFAAVLNHAGSAQQNRDYFEQIEDQLLNESHFFIPVSSQRNECWVNACLFSLLVQAQSKESLFDRIKEVKVDCNIHNSPKFQNFLNVYDKIHTQSLDYFFPNSPYEQHTPSPQFLPRNQFKPNGSNLKSISFFKHSQVGKSLVLGLAAGAEQDLHPQLIRRLNALHNSIDPLVEEDIVCHAHRVANLPCLVISKDNRSGFVSVMGHAVAPNEQAMLKQWAEKTTNTGEARSVVPINELQPLFKLFQHRPILFIQAEHYSVFMPKSHPVIENLKAQYNERLSTTPEATQQSTRQHTASLN